MTDSELAGRLYDAQCEVASIREEAQRREEANAALAASQLEKALQDIGNAKHYLDNSDGYL